jgi:hypothetical protein
MSTNIVSQILNMIAPSLLDKIATALGVNPSVAKAALAAAVPAVLGAIGSKATSEVGSRALFDAVSKTDASGLRNLDATLSGASGGKFLENGLGSLGSLLGDNALSGLTNAIGKQSGLGAEASSSIVGLASSLTMGQLAKSAAAGGLNASTLAGLLSSQQGNIASALPAGLGSMLSGAGVLGGGFAGQAGRAANEAVRSASAATHQAAHAAKKSGMNWLTWVIPLALIAAALWYFLGSGLQGAKDAAQQAAGSAASLVVDGVDLNSQISSVVDGLKSSLGGITDAASAQAALPKLEETLKSVDGLAAIMGKLSPEQKTMVGGLINGFLPTLKELLAKVLAIPGVGDVLKPTADGLMAKIEALANPV